MGHLPTHLKEGVPGSSFREGSEEGDCGPDQVSMLGAGVGVFPPVALASGKKNPPAMQETQETQV